MTTPKQQTPKDAVWKDAKGVGVPYNRTSALERLKERNAHRVLKEAMKVNQALTALKELVLAAHAEVLEAFKKSEGVDVKQTKGNKVWYSFDRSVMVECSVQENIRFDELLITAAREKLSQYLGSKLTSDEEFLVEMVTKAFETTNGKLDSKRIMHLLSYRAKVRATLFQEALDCIEKGMTRTYSKTYFNVSVMKDDGSYEAVKLNFSQLLS